MSTTPSTKQKQSPQPLTASNEVIMAAIVESVWKNSQSPAPVIPLKDLQAFTQQAEHPGFHVYAHEDCYQVLTAEQVERTSKFFTRNADATFAMARDKAAKEGEELIKRGLTTAEELLNRLHTGLPEHSEPPEHFPPISSFIMRTAGEPTAARLQWLHAAWERARQECAQYDDTPPHPLAPIIKAWLQKKTTKHITREYDRLHPVAIIKSPMGSIRGVNFVSDIATLREFATPNRVEQADPNQLSFDFSQHTPSILPRFMPLDISTPTGFKPKTKSGAVSHEIRIFFEALMALEPSQQKADIEFRLGDLINYLYPDGKFNRTNQLPYIINALETLHFYATVPFRDDQGDLRRWRPVYVKSPLDIDAKLSTPVFMRVEMPPDARQGHLIIKEIHRFLAKTSAPQLYAYHAAAWIWDKYGTSKGGLLNPTKPVERRDNEKGLLDANGKPIVNSRGHKITNLYSSESVRQLPREENPSAINRYPVLSDEDLILACYPNGCKTDSRREHLKRAKKYWVELEKEGIVSIRKERRGWRILPSERHLREHIAVRKAAKKKVY